MVSPFTGGTVSTVAGSNDYRIDSLIGGAKWGGAKGTAATITYSFPQASSTWKNGYANHEPTGPGYHGLNSGEQAAVRSALGAWSDVANITFSQVTETPGNVGDIRVAYSGALSADAYAWAYYPGAYAEGGDVWLNANYGWTFGAGTYSQMAVMHELGHALGLKHDFEGSVQLYGAENTRQYTIMAYNGYSGADGEPITPMLYDVLAIQAIYGANMTTRTGDTVYTFAQRGQTQCIWDAGGIDTFDCSGQTAAVTIDLRAGSFSSIGTRINGARASQNVAIAFGATIENATGGAGNDVLGGNAVANVLIGGAGADSLAGGLGNDTYVVDSVGDRITEAAGQGTDLVSSAIAWTLAANVENLTLTGSSAVAGTGNDLGNVLTGNAAANALLGLAGNDTLAGGGGNDTLDGGAGADSLAGGTGNDTYVIDTASDRTVEAVGEGTDTVLSAIAWTLAAETENLTLTGSAGLAGTGNTSDNVLTGNAGANALSGLAGNDTLDGGGGNDTLDGGAGVDRLAGGAGNDLYLVDATADTVIELTGGGMDTIMAAVAWTLGTEIENLTLTGSAGLAGTGNTLGNALTGNAGANALSGLTGNDTLAGGAGDDTLSGGSGNDSMAGGLGNDTYVVDSTGDRIVELAGQGFDTVQADVTWTLGSDFECLTLSGAANINGSGNTLANVLTGNGGANSLSGLAGDDTLVGAAGDDTLCGDSGNDSMTGGLGNDTYVVDAAGDRIVEAAGQGTDTVLSSLAWTLGSDIENLTLTGSGNVSGGGNASANVLTGNAGANSLTGLAGNDTLSAGSGDDTLAGGLGDDRLTGGAGVDRFDFAGIGGTDSITDFQNGVDHIRITGYGTPLDDFGDLGIAVVGGAVRIDLHNGVTGAGFVFLVGITNAALIDATDFFWS